MIRAERWGRSNVDGRRAGGAPGILVGLVTVLTAGSAGPALAFQAAEEPARPASAGEKARLTPLEARELAQALRQLQAAVQADREAKAVEVQVHRPERTVTPPTLTPAELDRLVERYLTKNDPKVDPAPITTDVEFVRRIYFDLVGKPPTPEEFVAFVRDRSHDKRAKLIDSLLGSPDWARSWARYWRDVIKFHATNENLGRVRFDEMEDWLADQLRAHQPWDAIAARMIAATGRNDENGAVAFPLAYDTQPVEMAGEVSRIFLGVQIQCAQCHDHKTDSWKRRQFHEFAAFFAGARQQQVAKPAPGQLPVIAVVAQPRARYTMPDKDNPAKQIPIAPRFFLTAAGSKAPDAALPEGLAPAKRRELIASYITGQDNPWFARAFVNRTWYALMGEAFYEPIDDMGPERTAKAPEILEPLADQWQRGGYDVRWLYRTILNTKAYQRRVRSTATAAGKTQFASNCPSRLRADQVFEALAQALALPLDAEGHLIPPPAQNNKNPRPAAVKKAIVAAGLPLPAGKKVGPALRRGGPQMAFDRLFGVDPSISNDDVLGTIPQALFMMNSPLVNGRIAARPGTVLGQVLASTPDERSALNALYIRVLSRQPTAKEVEICGRYVASVGNPREAFEDIYWSLINSTEFVTRR
jgi:Protein of unknown function (DUF1549)/Protein of unknown function (DUF1553)